MTSRLTINPLSPSCKKPGVIWRDYLYKPELIYQLVIAVYSLLFSYSHLYSPFAQCHFDIHVLYALWYTRVPCTCDVWLQLRNQCVITAFSSFVYFQMLFLQWKNEISTMISLKFVPMIQNRQYIIIASNNGLGENRYMNRWRPSSWTLIFVTRPKRVKQSFWFDVKD